MKLFCRLFAIICVSYAALLYMGYQTNEHGSNFFIGIAIILAIWELIDVAEEGQRGG